MSPKKIYLAADLGAGSGRVLAGIFDGKHIELKELHRFRNEPLLLPSGYHWDISSLYKSILEGMGRAAREFQGDVVSLGIDTWGVDYGLLDKGGRLLGLPYQYRVPRTNGMMERADSLVGNRRLFESTGIQFMFFNTLYQLLSEAEAGSSALAEAEDLLFMPDLLGYWLTGERVQERSIASTSQLYNPRKRDWDRSLVKALGLPDRLFKDVVDSGTYLGALREEVAKGTGLKDTRVISVAGHDTASAVAAVPSGAASPAYLSSGTWSLMGLELQQPVITDASYADGFTNELGIGKSVRFLKNISGLWLIQEARRHWNLSEPDLGYGEISQLAAQAEPFRSFIDPDDPAFAQPGDMPTRIQGYCRETGQPVPESKGELARCIYESLALRYAEVWRKLSSYVPEKPELLHVVGGGCQERLLNQMTANATRTPVQAGPVEATGLGNVLAQMLADGSIASLEEGRQIVAASTSADVYEPEDSASWDAARERFCRLTEKSTNV